MQISSTVVAYAIIIGVVVLALVAVVLNFLDRLPHSWNCDRSDCHKSGCVRRRQARFDREIEFRRERRADIAAFIGRQKSIERHK